MRTITCTMVDQDALTLLKGELSALVEGAKSSGEMAAAIEQKLAEYREKPMAISEEALAESQETGEDVPVITVWYLDYNMFVRNAIRDFSRKRNDVRIEGKVCYFQSYDEGVLKLAAEIMAGEGPDIICFTPDMFNSLHKIMESGAFCDLSELIANDDTFGNLDLNQEVLAAGVYHGKRYFIPLRYEFPLLLSIEGVLEKNGITISDDWTLEDLGNTVADYAARTGNQFFFSNMVSFDSFINFCGRSFIDYETGRSQFQSEEFINLLELYREIYPYIMSLNELELSERPEESMMNGRFVMDFDTALSPDQVQTENSIYRGITGEDMALYPFPTIDGGTERPVIIRDSVAVSQNCKNKQAALDFIEELLSTDKQAAFDQYEVSNYNFGMPVNNEALPRDLDDAMNMDTKERVLSAATSTGVGVFPMLQLPQPLADRMTRLTDNIVVMPVIDNAVADIINEGVQSFLDGKRTARQAARDIDDKVRLFLNE